MKIPQESSYSSFGGLFEEGALNTNQTYKYNGNELDRMHGLDWYNYGARNYDAAFPVWTTVDLLAGKFPSVSPYVYCEDNPMIYIDPNGEAKIRASVSFSMTTGVIGFAAKVLDVAVGTVFSDGASNGWKAYVEFDTQSMDVKIGAMQDWLMLKPVGTSKLKWTIINP